MTELPFPFSSARTPDSLVLGQPVPFLCTVESPQDGAPIAMTFSSSNGVVHPAFTPSCMLSLRFLMLHPAGGCGWCGEGYYASYGGSFCAPLFHCVDDFPLPTPEERGISAASLKGLFRWSKLLEVKSPILPCIWPALGHPASAKLL